MRSYNEAWALGDTLTALRAQEERRWELIVIDSGSVDGSQQLIKAAQPKHFIQITPKEYNPSRVMNMGMRLARANTCIFINADATPQGSNWLAPLVDAIESPGVAACFGRQIPRPDCQAVFACDYERCFGEGRESSRWEHFFSMVSSGLRKEVWAKRGFREDLQYAEDDEYTRWCKEQGHQVVYVPQSVAMHSHNYTPEQSYRRAFGDALAIGTASGSRVGTLDWPRMVLLGWLNDARQDWTFCRRHKRTHEMPHALRIRWRQRRGRFAGLVQARREAHLRGRK